MRKRLGQIIGTTPRARMLSVATLIAIVVAVGAFALIDPASDGSGQDAFTGRADRECAKQKLRIAALERGIAQQPQPDIEEFASGLVEIVEEWRVGLDVPSAPAVDAADAQALDSALVDVLIQAGGLARLAREGTPTRVAAQAALVDQASAHVDAATKKLGLDNCSKVHVSGGRS